METKNYHTTIRFLPIAYGIMFLVIFILPIFSYPQYSIVKNTTSHLGSQFAPYAIIMNATFILLGIASVVDGFRVLNNYYFHKAVLLIFGLSLIGAAYFQHAPLIEEMPRDVQQDKLHSFFSSLTGTSFVVYSIATTFIVKDRLNQYMSLAIGVIAVVLTFLMFRVESFMGIWQRLIFISAFGWLVHIHKPQYYTH